MQADHSDGAAQQAGHQHARTQQQNAGTTHLEHEHDVAEIRSLDLRDGVLLELVREGVRREQAEALARGHAAGAAGALLRRRAGHLCACEDEAQRQRSR